MNNNLMGVSVRHLRRWRARQPLDHRQWNEPVDLLNDMTRGVGVPRQVMARVGGAPPAAVSATAQFRLTQSADAFPDHLVCRTWDGETQGDEDVLVAKPWDLRQTSFDGRGDAIVYRYTYLTPTRREAEVRVPIELVESQIIIRRYTIGDVLYATTEIERGTGVTHEDEPVVWLDDGGGRAFAAMFMGG